MSFARPLLAFALTLSLACTAQAQQLVKRCATDEMVQKALAEHPELRENMRRLEEETRQAEEAQRLNRGIAAPGDPIRIIPVVFHIIHDNGSENISDAQILDGIRIMNEDYAKRNADTAQVSAPFRDRIGTTNFEFRLARKDPSGNCTNGITRTVSDLTNSAGENVKQLIAWPANKYLNIWVVKHIASGAGGYSYYPGSAPAGGDGIVTLHTQTGSIGTGGGGLAARTLSHEAGHYFNLPHTWGNSNDPGLPSNCNMDDGVADTPNTIGVDGQGCNLNMMSCTPGQLANVENIMDYGSCPRMFTEGQSARMRTAANSSVASRSSLWSDANLQATGVLDPVSPCRPDVAFTIPQATTCPGKPITLNANITGTAVDAGLTLVWTLPGAIPSTSNEINPTVVYPSEGVYSVKLKAFNVAGADSFEVAAAVAVSGNERAYLPGQVEGFELASFPQAGSNPFNRWYFDNGGAPQTGWAPFLTAGHASSRSLRVRPAVFPTGTLVSAISASFDLTNISTDAMLLFKMASARRNDVSSDELTIYSSVDCGETFTRRRIFTGANAYTTSSNFAGSYIPQAGDWVSQSVRLNTMTGMPDVRFKFEVETGGGSGFYLDSLVVFDPNPPAAALAGKRTSRLRLAPVPANAQLTVATPGSGSVVYTVSDALGRRLMHGNAQASFSLTTAQLPTGAYLLQVEQNGVQYLERFVIDHTLAR